MVALISRCFEKVVLWSQLVGWSVKRTNKKVFSGDAKVRHSRQTGLQQQLLRGSFLWNNLLTAFVFASWNVKDIFLQVESVQHPHQTVHSNSCYEKLVEFTEVFAELIFSCKYRWRDTNGVWKPTRSIWKFYMLENVAKNGLLIDMF